MLARLKLIIDGGHSKRCVFIEFWRHMSFNKMWIMEIKKNILKNKQKQQQYEVAKTDGDH